MRRVCVFCGSSSGANPAYAATTIALADEVVRRGLGLVYGGGNVGLMGILADRVLAAGGEVTGVIPDGLATKEVAHEAITELRVVASMHERKAVMADLADGFLALPGGLGTLEELFEILTWAQLGIHAKPCGLLDVDGFYAPLISCLDTTVRAGFVKPVSRDLLLVEREPAALLDRFEKWSPPATRKWLGLEGR
jgi:uncharacterized protein (TIGR00730 family)